MRRVFKWSMLIIACVVLGMSVSGCGALATVISDVAPVTNELATATGGGNISTPSRRMEVKVTKAELIENGKKFLLEFLLINHGEDLKDYRINSCIGTCSTAYDNLGTQASFIEVRFGGSLPSETPIKVMAIISGFSSQATVFSHIQIHASCHNSDKCAGSEGDYVFKNVPIE